MRSTVFTSWRVVTIVCIGSMYQSKVVNQVSKVWEVANQMSTKVLMECPASVDKDVNQGYQTVLSFNICLLILSVMQFYELTHILFCCQITRKMRKSLESLGYNEKDINKMTPGEASSAVNRCIKKCTTGPLTFESQIKGAERRDN